MIEKYSNAESESAQKTQLSADFRETLLKSGLDISAFQTEKSGAETFESGNIPAVSTVNITADENSFPEGEYVQARTKSTRDEKTSADERRWKWQQLLAVAGILTIIVLQMFFQFSFIRDDNFQVAEDLRTEKKPTEIVKTATPQIETAELKNEPEAKIKIVEKTPDSEISPQSKKIAPKFKREQQPATSEKIAFRKKQQRSSSDARLRRAEKLLTGF